jgi:hypothetical protein
MSSSALRRRSAALAVLGLLAAGCTHSTPGRAPSASSPAPSGVGAATCPSSYAAPDPTRPGIRLAFDLADELTTVRGTEDVQFTPDRPVTELVFRLTANTAPSVQEGNGIQVTAARSDPAGGAYRFEPAGAGVGTQGGLLVLPLGRQVPAGQRVTAHVEFTLTLGEQAFDRFGRSGEYAWWGSGQPLLAWQRGVGWHREPLLRYTAESATSEAARTDLTVTAPARFQVLASGTPDEPARAGKDRRRWHSVADRARDVSVAVGPFRVRTGTVAGTTVRVATGPDRPADQLLSEAERGVRALSERFGPPPFPVITLTRLPIGGGGIEYPGSILLLDNSRVVTVHELAHQWFYAMVGNSQALDPWLDEAFATYAEALVDGTAGRVTGALRLPGDVGQSTAHYGADSKSYYEVTYGKGAAALIAARAAGPPAKFDAALRCYVNANAWRVARPADLAAALSGLPGSVKVLQDAGALPK